MNLTHREKQIIKYTEACSELPSDLVPNSEIINLLHRLYLQVKNADATCQTCYYFEYLYPETGMGYSRGKCKMLSYDDKESAYAYQIFVMQASNVMGEVGIITASNFCCKFYREKE